MATIKSYSVDVGSSIMKCITDLKNEKNSKSHLTTYENLTQLVLKPPSRSEPIAESLQSIAIPITLQDIANGNDALVLAALSFLGGSLQVLKLSSEKINLVVEVLTEKLEKVSEKNQSRKLMWSLANIQTDKETKLSNLEKMLHAACKFLSDNPPVFSLSTVCESLNTLRNVGGRHHEFFQDKLPIVLCSVIPWLFNEADRIRELSLICLEPFTAEIASKRLFDPSLQNLLRSKYYGMLTQLVLAESADSLKIWSFLIQAFGTQLHDSVSLLNELLKIEESALKCKNPAFRQQALEHWKYIIDCFALNPAVLNNSKRIKLVLVPLKSTDTRTVDFSKTKIELWWHLLNKLGPNAELRFHEVTLPLLIFCFGVKGDSQHTVGTALVFSNVVPLATAVLAGILSNDDEFQASPIEGVQLSRTHPFLRSEDFMSSVEHLSQLSLLTLSLKTENDEDCSYEIIIRSFIERCCAASLKDPLNKFISSLLTTVTTKPGLMEMVFEVLARSFSFPLLVELISNNMDCLFDWFIEHEPLPSHHIVCFLSAFFDAGLTWNTSEFTSNFIRSFEATACNQDSQISYVNSTSTELWSQFAKIIVAKRHLIDFKNINRQLLKYPFPWSQKKSDKSFFEPWSGLVSNWMKSDSSVMETVLNPNGLDEARIDLSLVRCFVSAIRLDLPLFANEISSWIKRWTTSWVKFADNNENQPKHADLFVDFISLLVDELDENSTEYIEVIQKCLQETALSTNSSNIINGVFGPVSTCFKGEKVQKLRKNSKVNKIFSTLVTKSNQRNKQKPKFLDDFVVVPPTQKKRVLTEHQKDVMRSKRRASCVPAMYNDLSQNSSSQSVDTNLEDFVSVRLETTCLPIVREEDALLEPPNIPQPSKVQHEVSSPALANEDKGDMMVISSPNQLCQKDLKLRSKVSVQVSKLPNNRRLTRRTSSLPFSPSSTAEPSLSESSTLAQDSVVFQRPGPASKKRALTSTQPVFKKARAANPVEVNEEAIETPAATDKTRADKSCNKENGSTDLPSNHTSGFAFTSPRRVSLQPVVDNLEQETPTLPSSSEEFEVANQEEKSPVNPTIDVIDLDSPDDQPVLLNNNQPVIDKDGSQQKTTTLPISSGKHQMANEVEISAVNPPNNVVDLTSPDDEPVVLNSNQPASDTDCVELCEIDKAIPDNLIPHEKPKETNEAVIRLEGSTNDGSPKTVPIEQNRHSNQEALSEKDLPVIVLPSEEVTNGNEVKEANHSSSATDTENQKQPDETVALEVTHTMPQKIPLVQFKSMMKSLSMRTKKVGTPKSIGPSPSTGKRGAQILELSRKIHNEPPNKKSKKTESPQREGVEPTIALGETVITPEGSPARTQQWIPRTYSPFASPSTSILKKRAQIDESADPVEGSPASSASKSRRVSFADPEVSHSVKISPVNKKLTRNRTRRSLITTYEVSLDKHTEIEEEINQVVATTDNNPSSDVTEGPNEAVTSLKDPIIPSIVITSTDEPQTSDLNSGRDSHLQEGNDNLETKSKETIESPNSDIRLPLNPKWTNIQEPLTAILDQLTSPTSRALLLATFEKFGVHTVGEFCSLAEADITEIDFQLPENETIIQFLDRYFEKKLLTESEVASRSASPALKEIPAEITTEEVSDVTVSSSAEMTVEELVQSSDDVVEEEATKSLDISPNGQILTDSPIIPSSLCDFSKSSCDVRDIQDDHTFDTDDSEKSNSGSIPVPLTDTHTNGFQNLSADEVINLIEQHPLKDVILSNVVKKFVSFSYNINGKVFPFHQE